MPEFFDITKWTTQPYFSTKGTRSKSVVLDANGNQYYFKSSLLKPGKDYKFEFWSEVIAFEIGSMLGLNVLKYDVAIKGDEIGCISKSMINNTDQILTEGVQYLQGYDPNFAPGEAKGGSAYTFDLIIKSLQKFEMESFAEQIIELVLFDSIIGNGDRHQENWGFISEHTYLSKRWVEFVRMLKKFIKYPKLWDTLPGWFRFLIKRVYLKGTSAQLREEVLHMHFKWNKNVKFAPIYDNGSSLARELSDDRIAELCGLPDGIQKYIDNGRSEIHWDGKKLNHFELIKAIMVDYPRRIERMKQIINQFNKGKLIEILDDIDRDIPERFSHYKLSDNRKRFILQLVISRITRLETLING